MKPEPDQPEQDAARRAGGSDWREMVRDLAGSARRAGRSAVVSGRWLAETVVELAPRVPVRDAATLSAHHDGLTGEALARAVVRSAGRVSAGMAAATGGLVTAQGLSVAGLVAVPFELAALTALVALVELKLVAELHQLAGRPLGDGPLRRSGAALTVWMSGRAAPPGASPTAGAGSTGDVPAGGSAGPAAASSAGDSGSSDARSGAGSTPGVASGGRASGDRTGGDRGPVLSRAARRQLVAVLRRRFGRNLAALGPLLTGAAAAGYLNRRATVSIGNQVARDLGLRR